MNAANISGIKFFVKPHLNQCRSSAASLTTLVLLPTKSVENTLQDRHFSLII
ncbi:DUF5951 family protein [Pseudescherichia sp.]|uniref:DUF5951 family protein n=1 Tax=Pseudescherichia sp. TaxID=2055881 RepID=UPI00390C9670